MDDYHNLLYIRNIIELYYNELNSNLKYDSFSSFSKFCEIFINGVKYGKIFQR